MEPHFNNGNRLDATPDRPHVDMYKIRKRPAPLDLPLRQKPN